MYNPEWFKVDCIHEIIDGFKSLDKDQEEDPVLRTIRLRQLDLENEGFEITSVYINVLLDPVINLLPVCVIPSGSNKKNHYTDIVTLSGTVIRAVGHCDKIYDLLQKQITDK